MRAPETDGLTEPAGRVARGSPYLAQLDSLRALAVAAVLLHHYASTYFDQSFGGVARAGVQLFFVLSGFLITGILLRARLRAARTGGSRFGVLRRFYARPRSPCSSPPCPGICSRSRSTR